MLTRRRARCFRRRAAAALIAWASVLALAGAARADPTLVAAGDIACHPGQPMTPTSCRQMETAALVHSLAPTAVAVLGDNAYDSGTPQEYASGFGASWGPLFSLIHPVPGNEDYGTAGAGGYFGYFGAAAGAPGSGYYSWDLGTWHLVALNSNCAEAGGCGPGSPQDDWLRADLAANRSPCTLAYWHHPLFTSTGAVAPNLAMRRIWSDLQAVGADLVLNGHAHLYERFAPQDALGNADQGGIREIVAGTGGKSLHTFSQVQANSERRDRDNFGVLEIRLGGADYGWRFISTAHATLDAGSASCHVPGAATGTAQATGGGGVRLTGTASPHGTATTARFEYGTTPAYGATAPAGSAPASGTPYPVAATLTGLAPGTTYHYRLVVQGLAGRTAAGGDATFATGSLPLSTASSGAGGTSAGTGPRRHRPPRRCLRRHHRVRCVRVTHHRRCGMRHGHRVCPRPTRHRAAATPAR